MALEEAAKSVGVLNHVEETGISGDVGSHSVQGAYLKTRINLAAVHEVMEVVRDFQDVPLLKGKKMSAASGKCPISAAGADNWGGSHLLLCVDLALHGISVEQETCHSLLVLGWGLKGCCWRSPWHYRGEVPGAGQWGNRHR